MSDTRLGLGKPAQQKSLSASSQLLPLVSVPSHHQTSSGMTRLAPGSQGGRIPIRSPSQSGVTDSSMMATLLANQTNSHPNLVNTLNSPGVRKRKALTEDYVILRRKVTENHYIRLQRLQTMFAEQSAFLCFLQANGQFTDFNTWRTRLPATPLNNFFQSNKLNPQDENEDLYLVLQNRSNNFHLPSGLSSRSSQGVSESSRGPSDFPSKKETLSSGLSCTASNLPSSSPLKTGSPHNLPSHENSVSSQEQIVERAKQEAYVMQRIGELQKDGLWAEKRLPKLHELPRAKAHWDYLIEEMMWLAADFAQERKWKKAAAKKCARMVQKYFQEKEALAQKAVKAQEMQLKRIAGFIAREVKQFWNNVEKLVEFKQQTRLEEKRKKALDQHLSFIVDQTEKYSSLVAESMNSSRPTSPKHHSDVEFEPEGSSDDDEETIAKEEALSAANKEAVSEEIDALKRESELPLEDLLSDYLSKRDKLDIQSNDSNDEEFRASDNDSIDDEETIHEQEQLEGSADHEEEINELKAEGEMSIEELRMKYTPGESSTSCDKSVRKYSTTERNDDSKLIEEDVDVDENEVEGDVEDADYEEDSEDEDIEESSSNEQEEDSVLKTLLNDATSDERKDQEINDVAAIALSLQPKGNTLSSTSVVTKVPFLLKHPLREYQHIGLDWLVTMYDRKLNGILADEMGLGKTIQTIALLGHLACEKGNWGPHLIVVPTSVMLNWEMEFKKWCPAFKILTYYGSQKERKMKRSGWTKPNAFHVCITSYKLVIQDHQSFRRKKWKYLILDEAQNIKNFKSQRWQLLLNFQTLRRLLLTGTPLQNNLMELWSLMHFLMPNVFESHREFKEWFSNPVTGMIEGNSEYNENIIKRLHKVLRPFLLRRLKSEVETQMPKKYEHIIMCRLSNRQRYLYDDFMSRAKTKETLATGNLLSVINVLMQLRKVCNHPNLFEVRPTVSPFQMEGLTYSVPSLVWAALDYDPFKHIDLASLNFMVIDFEKWLLAFVAHRITKFKLSPQGIKALDEAPPEPPRCPRGRVKINMKKKLPLLPSAQVTTGQARPPLVQVAGNNHRFITSLPATKVGTSPLIKTIVGQNSNQGVTFRLANPTSQLPNYVQLVQQPGGGVKAISVTSLANAGQVVKASVAGASSGSDTSITTTPVTRLVPQFAQLVTTPGGRQLVLSSQQVITSQGGGTTVMTSSGQRLTVVSKSSGTNVAKLVTSPAVAQLNSARPVVRVPPLNVSTVQTTQPNCVVISSSSTSTTPSTMTTGDTTTTITTVTTTSSTTAVANSVTTPTKNSINNTAARSKVEDNSSLSIKDLSLEERRKRRRQERLALIGRLNEIRCRALPVYGVDLVSSLTIEHAPVNTNWGCSGYGHCKEAVINDPRKYWSQTGALREAIHSTEDRVAQLSEIFSRFVLYVPAVAAPTPRLHVAHPAPWKLLQEQQTEAALETQLRPKFRLLHPISSAMSTQFPHPRLIQYDCGKLQSLDRLLRKLKSDHHRVLIFTQMTRMLDVLEAFLNFHGHIYLRLDGTTKVDQRQALMERFNADKRIFCFILSTRSGGVGINLTGADTVIFYDSDWNPTMDAQAQDRCHRIGQTRDVHIYRLVSEKTVEENILKKANQKRMLGDVAIEGGNFTTAYFKSSTIQDLFNVDTSENDASRRMCEVLQRDAEKRNSCESSMVPSSTMDEKSSIGALESALAQVEDETDVAAAKVAKAEAAAELAEFDENIPLETQEGQELSKAEQELNTLMQQLSGVEKYAMRFVEETETVWSAEQLAAAEAEIEQQKREWEQGRLAALRIDQDELISGKGGHHLESTGDINDDSITYSGLDARNQIWLSDDGRDIMPMWCPPTPPQDDSDVYIDHALGLLYQQNIMNEAQLPPVFVKKERKRNRIEANLPEGGRGTVPPVKVRQREDTLMHAPRSLFDRPSPALIKMRQELRLQRYRGLMRPAVQNMLKPQLPVKPLPEPEHVPDWVIQEDWTILQAIQQIQELTLNLVVLSPAHTPNWDMVADMVNLTSRTYRSPKQCKNRYESVIIPREEGKLIFDSPRKQKKTKTLYKPPPLKSGRPLRTSQLYQQDNNSSMTQVMNSRFDAIRSVSNRRAPTVKPLLVDPAMKNPKHAEVLSECAIDYDKPLSPIEVASRRADRIAKEKQAQQLQQQQHSKVTQTALAASIANGASAAGVSTTVQASSTRSSQATAHLQDVGSGTAAAALRGVISSPTSTSGSTSIQRSPTASLVSVQTSPSATSVKGTKTISAPQIVYQRQQHIQLKQQQLRVIQSRTPSSPGQKVSVAVTASSPTQRIQQVKAGGVTRTVSETEMIALLKRQQAKVSSSSTAAQLTSAQILAQAGLQAQQTSSNSGLGQVATLVKTVPANSLPVTGLTLPQMRAALGSSIKAGTVTPQQIRQLSLQQQIFAQHRKLPQQKVTQIGQSNLLQVSTKTGATAQLIVQSQKSIPTSVTMQQIQQVIRHVQPQHVVPAAQSSSTQVSHGAFAKTGGSQQARVIPVAASQQSIKQAIQVVTANSNTSPSTAGNVARTATTVTIDPSGRATQTSLPSGTIKATTSTQQAILTQVSAVLQQQGQPITVRHPVRIQATSAPLVAVTVSQAPATVLTLPTHENNQQL
ncbi:domino helicase isoform X3 [Rhodnius prolixus]|uniref:domino helicase isoform X3 n=1 Tax=Rhodnius prolixus TaxID=13249 RepID=UPI003D18BEAD